MSATPEQIVDWLLMVAATDAANEYTNRAEHMRAAAALIRAQAEREKVLVEALSEIAKQVPAMDMDDDYYEAADFEDGYDRLIFAARAALAGAR